MVDQVQELVSEDACRLFLFRAREHTANGSRMVNLNNVGKGLPDAAF